MPFISDASVVRLQETVAAAEKKAKLSRLRAAATAEKDNLLLLGSALASAGIIGGVRGKFEAADGSWEAFSGVDTELLITLTLLVLPFIPTFKSQKAMKQGLLGAGIGVASHYIGQVTRNFAKTGNFSLVAGGVEYPYGPSGTGRYLQGSGRSGFSLPRPGLGESEYNGVGNALEAAVDESGW